jgi:hypothetical protein
MEGSLRSPPAISPSPGPLKLFPWVESQGVFRWRGSPGGSPMKGADWRGFSRGGPLEGTNGCGPLEYVPWMDLAVWAFWRCSPFERSPGVTLVGPVEVSRGEFFWEVSPRGSLMGGPFEGSDAWVPLDGVH